MNFSSWDCTIEPPQRGQHSVESVSAPVWARPESVPAVCGLLSSSAGEPKGACRIVPTLRLGMRMVKGLGRAQAAMIQRARLERESARQPSSARRPSLAAAGGGQGWPPPIIELAFADIASLQQASGAAVAALRQLAAADAFASMGLGRQAAMWQILALDNQPMPLFNSNGEDNPQISQIAQISNSNCNNKDNPQIAQISLPQPTEARCAEADLLPQMTDLQEVLQDYQQLGLSLRRHPMSFLRKRLQGRKVATAIELRDARRKAHGSWASVAGIVLVRQRPSSAAGVLFLTLEDETGSANVMVRPAAYLRMKRRSRARCCWWQARSSGRARSCTCWPNAFRTSPARSATWRCRAGISDNNKINHRGHREHRGNISKEGKESATLFSPPLPTPLLSPTTAQAPFSPFASFLLFLGRLKSVLCVLCDLCGESCCRYFFEAHMPIFRWEAMKPRFSRYMRYRPLPSKPPSLPSPSPMMRPLTRFRNST